MLAVPGTIGILRPAGTDSSAPEREGDYVAAEALGHPNLGADARDARSDRHDLAIRTSIGFPTAFICPVRSCCRIFAGSRPTMCWSAISRQLWQISFPSGAKPPRTSASLSNAPCLTLATSPNSWRSHLPSCSTIRHSFPAGSPISDAGPGGGECVRSAGSGRGG